MSFLLLIPLFFIAVALGNWLADRKHAQLETAKALLLIAAFSRRHGHKYGHLMVDFRLYMAEHKQLQLNRHALSKSLTPGA